MKRSANHQQRFIIIVLILTGLLIGYSLQQKLRFYRNDSNHAPKSAHLDSINDDQVAPIDSQAQHSDNDKTTTLSGSMLKSFARFNSMRAYHLDLHAYRDEVKFGGDAKFVDSLSEEHKQRCTSHLQTYHNLLKQYHTSDPISELTSKEALELADTFGRPEAAVLNGNQFWLGNYERCQAFSSRQFNGTLIKSQYCLGIVQYPNWKPSEGKTSLKVGLCLPETCTNHMLNEMPALLSEVQTMMMYQIHPSGPFAKLNLRSVYCLPHETSELRQLTSSAKTLIALIACLVSFSVFATLLDNRNTWLSTKEQQMSGELQQQSSTWKLILIESFSITRNVSKLFHIREEPQAKTGAAELDSRQGDEDKKINGLEIAGIDYVPFDVNLFFNTMAGLKSIGLFWIIAAHTMLVAPILSVSLADLDSLTKTYLADFLLGAHFMVDTFFVMMGMIASFLVFKGGINKIKTRHWIIMTVHRYWRLTPIYLLCYWYTKSLGSLANSGPLWDFASSDVSPRVNCARESWFTAILHLSDFKSPKDHCVPFAWFIANGIKFAIITPFLLVPLGKSIKRGYAILLSVLLANTILVYWLASKAEVDVAAMIEFKPESADNMLNNMGEIYTRPYSRIGAYVIGLIAGHLFYLEHSGLLRVKMSREAFRIGWILCISASLGLIFLLKLLRHLKLDEAMMRDSFSAGSALVRPLWSICSCWLVFALAHGKAQWLSKFLSAKFWLICVKLSFCAYLSQGEVIANIFLAATTVQTTYQYLNLISDSIFTIVLTVLLSFLMVIFIEYPLNGIERIILPEKRPKPATSSNNSKQQAAPDDDHKMAHREELSSSSLDKKMK